MCRDRIDILKFFLTERAGEVLRGVYSGVEDEVILRRKAVLTLFAAVLV